MSLKRGQGQTRDAPAQNNVLLCDANAWRTMCGTGYRPIMECPEIQACINVYADMIANMPIQLMENTERGDVRIKNQLSRKLDIEPNRYMVRQTFVATIVRVMMTHGNQVTLPTYTADGLLEELMPLEPSKVGFMETQDGYRIMYGNRVFEPDEVLHFPLNPDPERPWLGIGYRAMLSDVVKGIRQANQTRTNLMENPAPSLIVKVDGYLDELETPEARDRLAKQYVQSAESGKPWMLQADAFTVEQVRPMTMADLAIDKSLELDKRTAAAIMGVPSFLVGVGTFDQKEFDWFVATRLMSIAHVIEQVMTRGLLYAPEWYIRLSSKSLLNYDITRAVDMGKEMVDRIAMTRNEWRDWLGLSPLPEMDELLALENYIPANKLGQQSKLMGGEDDAQ